METHDELKERVRCEQHSPPACASPWSDWKGLRGSGSGPSSRLISRSLSIHQIASTTGLSSSRVHQLLGSDEAREIPEGSTSNEGEIAPTPTSGDCSIPVTFRTASPASWQPPPVPRVVGASGPRGVGRG